MMQRLGMNIDTDSTDMQYRWIAEAALVQPLPKNWQEHTDPNGYAYFHNLITNETTWEPPQTRHFIDLYNKLKIEAVNQKLSAERNNEKEMQLDALKNEQERKVDSVKLALEGKDDNNIDLDLNNYCNNIVEEELNDNGQQEQHIITAVASLDTLKI